MGHPKVMSSVGCPRSRSVRDRRWGWYPGVMTPAACMGPLPPAISRAAGQVAPADVAIAPVTDDADPGELLGLLGPVACPHHQRVARRAPGVRARAVVRAEEPSAGT